MEGIFNSLKNNEIYNIDITKLQDTKNTNDINAIITEINNIIIPYIKGNKTLEGK